MISEEEVKKKIEELQKNHKETKKPCLFLDRDGVIIEDSGYPHRVEQMKPIRGVMDIIHWARKNGFWVIVVTNQAGIAKGKFSMDQFTMCTNFLNEYFAKFNITFDAWYVCPYHPDGIVPQYKQESFLRKPWPGMVLKALEEFPIDLKKSLMIGDKESDRLKFLNLRTFLIRGAYALSSKEDVFDSHENLLKYLIQHG